MVEVKAMGDVEAVVQEVEEALTLPSPKQVIVIRHDLHMRMGKAIAQGAHASMAFLTGKLVELEPVEDESLELSDVQAAWFLSGTKKICVRVDSLEQLLAVEKDAWNAGLEAYRVTDAGHTEFHGEPTVTGLAIGPDYPEKIDKVTRHLKLL